MSLKKIIPLYIISMLLLSLVACGCDHEWTLATCTEAAECTKCGELNGDPAGHLWVDADCDTAKTCALCGESEGGPLGHAWVEATCAKAKHCSMCGKEEGEALVHEWTDATCTEPTKCVHCDAREGEPLGHDFSKMKVITEATCTEMGYAEGVCAACGETTGQDIPLKEHKMSKWTTIEKETCTENGIQEQKCTICGYSVSEEIPMKGHKEGEWTITTKASYDSAGERTISCRTCKEVLKTESYELTEEEKVKDYKKKCKNINYKDICRNPDNYKGELVKISGTVFQEVSEAENILEYSVYFVKASGNLYCVFIDNYGTGTRILEDDRITIYGEIGDLLTYETIRGNSNTIPKVYAEYYQ